MEETKTLESQIDYNSSAIDEQPTLLLKFQELYRFVKSLDKHVNDKTLKNVMINVINQNQFKIKFIYEDNTFLESEIINLPTFDAFDLMDLIEANQDIVVDINQENTKIEIHLDEAYKNSLSTKKELQTATENVTGALQLKVDKTQLEPLETAIGQHTISIENLKKGKQDKLSQVDLDNIAMINQYGEDIGKLKNDKQDKLISGTNIKTINNQNILGQGNIEISGGGSGGGTKLYRHEISISFDAEQYYIDALSTDNTKITNMDKYLLLQLFKIEAISTNMPLMIYGFSNDLMIYSLPIEVGEVIIEAIEFNRININDDTVTPL